MSKKSPQTGFPNWAAPGIGSVLGAFFGFATLLQSEPLSSFSPPATIGVGAAIGLGAGVVLMLWKKASKG